MVGGRQSRLVERLCPSERAVAARALSGLEGLDSEGEHRVGRAWNGRPNSAPGIDHNLQVARVETPWIRLGPGTTKYQNSNQPYGRRRQKLPSGSKGSQTSLAGYHKRSGRPWRRDTGPYPCYCNEPNIRHTEDSEIQCEQA